MIWIGNLIAPCDRMILSSLVMWALWMIMLNPSYPTTMEMRGIFFLHSKEVLQSLTWPLLKVIFVMLLIAFANIKWHALLFLGFTFSEVNCWRTSNSKVVCCHFSSDGKILASAGHEKKVKLSCNYDFGSIRSCTFFETSDVLRLVHFIFAVGCTLEHGKFPDTVYIRRAWSYYYWCPFQAKL